MNPSRDINLKFWPKIHSDSCKNTELSLTAVASLYELLPRDFTCDPAQEELIFMLVKDLQEEVHSIRCEVGYNIKLQSVRTPNGRRLREGVTDVTFVLGHFFGVEA